MPVVDINSVKGPVEASFALYQKDNTNPSQYLNWGFPLLNKALLGLDKGVFLIASPANQGKSSTQRSMVQQLVDNNDDVFVIDLTLDDDKEERIRGYVASMAKLPVNWIKYPEAAGMTPALRDLRSNTYKEWSRATEPKLRIIDATDFEETAGNLSVICDVVKQYRDAYPDKKLVVALDGFHDVVVDNFRGDELPTQRHLSKTIKQLATNEKAVFVVTSHTPKGSLKRGLDQDAVLGTGRTTFDARVIATIYSDYSVNRHEAQVLHHAVLPHNNSSTPVPQPVIELDVTKNKSSSFKDIIFYRFYAEYGYIEEAEPQWQTTWKSTVYGSTP